MLIQSNNFLCNYFDLKLRNNFQFQVTIFANYGLKVDLK